MEGVILLLEDEESVNRGVSFTLEKAGYQVYACGSICEAEQVLETHQPQMLICDLTLPDGNGLDLIKKVRKAQNDIYILCLTALDSETDYVMGYGAGADDYVAKPFSLSVLTLKVQAYFERNKKASNSEISFGKLRVNMNEMRAWRENEELFFTKTEWKLLILFVQNPNQILSKNQILEFLFDAEGDFVEENTIAVMIRRLREKVEEDPAKPQYIKNVRGMGYILGGGFQ
ncbi:MAG: response regulator transcription factor [Lachnospiraceae bacterium]|nr:response regulator transcription factor [Lachnospiraceae bacterium]MDE7415078.1 response regulator transcription factor [Lachnospiraceae bacterium]